MESTQQLPSGRLVPASQLPFDLPLEQAVSMQKIKLDDVFYGMVPTKPTTIEYRGTGSVLKITASAQFTHLVVWTPDRPFFGVESQTCSTDAHNLYSAGKVRESHLQVCPPGETMSGWVEYRVTP